MKAKLTWREFIERLPKKLPVEIDLWVAKGLVTRGKTNNDIDLSIPETIDYMTKRKIWLFFRKNFPEMRVDYHSREYVKTGLETPAIQIYENGKKRENLRNHEKVGADYTPWIVQILERVKELEKKVSKLEQELERGE